MNKQFLQSEIYRNRQKIKSFGVHRLGLFGSFVRGQEKEDSDIDFLVEFSKEKKSYDNFIHLAFFLEDLLHRKVDLVTPKGLSPHIGPHIKSEVENIEI